MAREFTVRDLVHGPFKTCPQCGSPEFGVYGVHGHMYRRRCRACWHGQEVPLWPLSRKIIYIDQFAISDMMKTLNSEHPRHQAARRNPFWLQLFERLSRLRNLQFAIFPHSDVHRVESLVSDAFEPLKLMYHHLSYGVGFRRVDALSQQQVNTALNAWLGGQLPVHDFNPDRTTSGRLNEWPDSVIITADLDYPQSQIDSIRTFRDEVHRKIVAFYNEDLRTSKERSFTYWLERERRISGESILQSVEMYAYRMDEMIAGRIPFDLDNLYTSKAFQIYRLIETVMQESGVTDAEFENKLRMFLASDAYKDYPVNRISSLVWAAIDQAAVLGQGEPPNAGTSNDVEVLCLQPYCDAMFVDNGCRALWEKVPRRYRPPYARARLFSYNTRDAFFAYLDEVEREGDPAVRQCAQELIGDTGPYLTMYDDERRREQDR